MIIEIKGASFANKGAELMLLSIIQELRGNLNNPIIAVDSKCGDYSKRAELGLYQKLDSSKYISKFVGFIENTPLLEKKFEKIKKQFGLVSDRDLEIMLDASGFAYSDQWGSKPTEAMAALTEKLKKQGSKVIILPQAFGPFNGSLIRREIMKVVQNTDLLFARDKISYMYLVEVVGESPNIKRAPDFTNLIQGTLPPNYTHDACRVIVIPNYRMIDKTTSKISRDYFNTLCFCVEKLLGNDLKPVFLIHDTGQDFELSKKINQCLEIDLEIIEESNPLYIKGIIGDCFGVVSSRFHGLVNALSQGVPCIGMGWSHKYEMLFEDYNCPECLISPLESKKDVMKKLSLIYAEDSRRGLVKKIIESSKLEKEKVKEMWKEIFALI